MARDFLGDGQHNGNRRPAEYYRESMQQINEADITGKAYAPSTTQAVDRIRNQWDMYCKEVFEMDWREVLKVINIRIIYKFFEWHINRTVDKNGNRKRELGLKFSLRTMWCNFRLVYEMEMGFKINGQVDCQQVNNARERLSQDFNLTSQKRVNRPMSLADLTMQIDAIFRTTEKSFKIGEVRILTALCLLLLAPAGARIQFVLDMRFKDIEVVLSRDPRGGPHKLLVKFTMNFTKRYLGEKDAKTFLIPEIIYDPTMLLSPHVMLMGILFLNNAFKAEGLTYPDGLAALDIFPGEYELPLPFKDEIQDKLVFRRAVQTPMGWAMSDLPINKGMMQQWVKRIGELVGFEHSTMTYSIRYMAGNNLDRNVEVSDSFRNMAMDHAPSSDTFQKHYLNRHVDLDVWAIQLGAEPQKELVYQGASYGHSAVDDIERKLRGESFAPVAKARGAQAMSPAQQRLVDAITKPVITNFEEQLQRRANAMAAIMAYGPIEEPFSTKVTEAREPAPPPELKLDEKERIEKLRQFVCVPGEGEVEQLKRCFICVAKAFTLLPDDPNVAKHCCTYYSPAEAVRHFRLSHLRLLPFDAQTTCPICIPGVVLLDKMHLQNHAYFVHGLRT